MTASFHLHQKRDLGEINRLSYLWNSWEESPQEIATGLVLMSKAEKLCFSGWRQEYFRVSIFEGGVGKDRGRLGTTVTKKACANLMESCGVGRALT